MTLSLFNVTHSMDFYIVSNIINFTATTGQATPTSNNYAKRQNVQRCVCSVKFEPRLSHCPDTGGRMGTVWGEEEGGFIARDCGLVVNIK